jgi:hypothetical protein
MSNKQMTAVEWLYQEITKKSVNDQSHNVIGILNQAKELEKQEIIDAWYDGEAHWDSGKNGNEYYKETYGGQNNE